MSTYNQRLAINNTKIDEITEIARTLPPAGGSSDPNIFVQLEEPSKKDGIWLQTNKTAEHYISDDDVFIGGTWAPASETANIPYSFGGQLAFLVGTDIYLFGCEDRKKAYRYNTLTNSYTRLADIPLEWYSGTGAVVGTDIYLFGSEYSSYTRYYVYKYNIITNEYIKLSDAPSIFISGTATSIDTDIYLFGSNTSGYTRKAYKYNTLTDTYTQLTDKPNGLTGGRAVAIGTSIYLFGGEYSDYAPYLYKYNTLTNAYTQLTNVPYTKFLNSAISAIGNNIYIFGGNDYTTSCYKYNTLTDTYTKLTDIPFNFSNGSAVSVNNNIYLLLGTTNRKFIAESKSYETDNTVVIAQGKTYDIGYNTQLFDTQFEEGFQPLYGFADAWFYTLQDGLDGTMPVYYGDGTQWINIKNPQ